MSVAGKRSIQGDEYQIRVAAHWLIRLLEEDTLAYVQAEVIALPGDNQEMRVDDVVVTFKVGNEYFIQAKKNQLQHREWRLSDRILQNELCKANAQIETTEKASIWFYSRSPFGELKKLAEDCRTLYPEFPLFSQAAPDSLKKPLKKLAEIIDRPEEITHQLVKCIKFGPSFGFDDWDRNNRRALECLTTQPDTALIFIEEMLRDHQSGLRGANLRIRRTDVINTLQNHGVVLAPAYSEQEIIEQFREASGIGRNRQCAIGGRKIERIEQTQIIKLIETGQRAILVVDKPGSGKTCLLLSLADDISRKEAWELLFIKGDLFGEVKTETDLEKYGLPNDMIGKCARLAASCKVVVMVDSLDVLALNREHGALQVFLSLLDRMERLDNVTVIAACRSFDLAYDPLLRERQWGAKVVLKNLDFDAVVKPFLKAWGVDASNLPEKLKPMLGVPQNLRLFEAIAGRVDPRKLLSEYHL